VEEVCRGAAVGEVKEVGEVTEDGIPDARFRARSATHYCVRSRGGRAVGGQLGFDLPKQDVLRAAEPVGFREGHLMEPHLVARHGLGDLRKIRRDDRGDFRVAARGLFDKQNDGLTVGRQLDVSRHGGLRDDTLGKALIVVYGRPLEAAAHAVRLGCHLVNTAEEDLDP